MIQLHLYTSYQPNNLGQSLTFSGSIHTSSGSKLLKCKREVEIYPPLSSRSECLSSSEGSQGKILCQLWLLWKKRTLFSITEFDFASHPYTALSRLPLLPRFGVLTAMQGLLPVGFKCYRISLKLNPFPGDRAQGFCCLFPGCTGSWEGVGEPVPLDSLDLLPAA